MKINKITALAFATLLAACGGTEVIDTDDAVAVKEMDNVMELEYRDWTKTSDKMVGSMLKSPAFANVKNPIIAMGPMINDTMQRFDTDVLTKKIRTELVNSGKAKIATSFQSKTVTATGYMPVKSELNAVSVGGKKDTTVNAKADGWVKVEYEKPVSEDDSTHQMRALRDNAEYDKNTIAAKGTLVAPNMSLSGKMIQRNMRVDGGFFSSGKERVEYYLQLTLTDLKTGLSVWEDERPIIKEGKKAPRW